MSSFNDDEINNLEDMRRFGPPGDRLDEQFYYKLPPQRKDMMRDWTKWRTQVNDLMAEVIVGHEDGHIVKTERKLLTSSKNKKTPKFFKGDMSIHGLRAKDEYGASTVQETDDLQTKEHKKRMDENFYLFGIPRISLRRGSDIKVISDAMQKDHPSLEKDHVDARQLRDASPTRSRQQIVSRRRMSVPVLPMMQTPRLQSQIRRTDSLNYTPQDGNRTNSYTLPSVASRRYNRGTINK